MIADPVLPIVAILTGIAATAVWTVVFVRSVVALRQGVEQRRPFIVMASAALLASIGALASSIGYAIQLGLLPAVVPLDLLTFIASVGRGALLMAGLIVMTHYRPPRKEP